MTKRVLYVRHGQSLANLRGVFAGGQDDTPITELGRKQAKEFGESLRSQKIDRIIASPLERTRETAQIIAKEIGFDDKNIAIDDRLREYDVGSGNGQPMATATAHKVVSYPGAEDPQGFADRIQRALQDIKGEEGTTLIVAHGGVGKLIECLQIGNDPATFYDQPGFSNAQAIELDLSWLS